MPCPVIALSCFFALWLLVQHDGNLTQIFSFLITWTRSESVLELDKLLCELTLDRYKLETVQLIVFIHQELKVLY
jgi:hypothetical protein